MADVENGAADDGKIKAADASGLGAAAAVNLAQADAGGVGALAAAAASPLSLLGASAAAPAAASGPASTASALVPRRSPRTSLPPAAPVVQRRGGGGTSSAVAALASVVGGGGGLAKKFTTCHYCKQTKTYIVRVWCDRGFEWYTAHRTLPPGCIGEWQPLCCWIVDNPVQFTRDVIAEITRTGSTECAGRLVCGKCKISVFEEELKAQRVPAAGGYATRRDPQTAARIYAAAAAVSGCQDDDAFDDEVRGCCLGECWA